MGPLSRASARLKTLSRYPTLCSSHAIGYGYAAVKLDAELAGVVTIEKNLTNNIAQELLENTKHLSDATIALYLLWRAACASASLVAPATT